MFITGLFDYMMYRGFCFSGHSSVLCTGFTLGKYFVHVNISLIAPPGTRDVCFQVVCTYTLCVYLSASVVTLAECVLTSPGFTFIFPTKKEEGVSSTSCCSVKKAGGQRKIRDVANQSRLLSLWSLSKVFKVYNVNKILISGQGLFWCPCWNILIILLEIYFCCRRDSFSLTSDKGQYADRLVSCMHVNIVNMHDNFTLIQ